MFEAGILQSGFWHQFAMTAHSPVGLYPEKFNVVKESDIIGSFANNDIVHIDKIGGNHDKFSYGLKKSLFNYMHGICFDYPLQEWFEFKVPRTKIASDYIQDVLHEDENFTVKPTAKIVWLGGKPSTSYFMKSKKGSEFEMTAFTFHDKRESFTIQVPKRQGEWLKAFLEKCNGQTTTYAQAKSNYEGMTRDDFELFWFSKPLATLREHGLLVL